jgi:hypothetical protein
MGVAGLLRLLPLPHYFTRAARVNSFACSATLRLNCASRIELTGNPDAGEGSVAARTCLALVGDRHTVTCYRFNVVHKFSHMLLLLLGKDETLYIEDLGSGSITRLSL